MNLQQGTTVIIRNPDGTEEHLGKCVGADAIYGHGSLPTYHLTVVSPPQPIFDEQAAWDRIDALEAARIAREDPGAAGW